MFPYDIQALRSRTKWGLNSQCAITFSLQYNTGSVQMYLAIQSVSAVKHAATKYTESPG